MIETTILIPLRANDGKAFPRRVRAEFESRLLAVADGFSVEGAVRGDWRDADGTIYHDDLLRYVVAIATLSQLARWSETVRWARIAFGQISLYVSIAGVPLITDE